MILNHLLRCGLLVCLMAASHGANVAGPSLPTAVDLGIPSSTSTFPLLKNWVSFGRLHGPDGQASFCNGHQVYVGPLITSPAPTAANLGRTIDGTYEAIAFIDNVSGPGSDAVVRSDYLWVQDGRDLAGNQDSSVVTLRILKAKPGSLIPDFASPFVALQFNVGNLPNFSLINSPLGYLTGRGPDIPAIVADFNHDGNNDLIVWNPGQDQWH